MMNRYYSALEEIAYDLTWSWDHRADLLWKSLDPELWELTHNPLVILQTTSKEKLKTTLSHPYFHQIVYDLKQKMLTFESNTDTWFHRRYPKNELSCLAYFSMEFMLSETLPIYSGGLGNVAGDQLKAMNDLGVPAVGIGLLYQQGYFRQVIDSKGIQQALYPYNSPEQLPIKPVRLKSGEWLRIEIDLPGWKLWLRTWEVKIGRVKLYLLDSNDAANYPPHRAITSELYGGGPELRLQQEIVLGIGGTKLLQALNICPEVYHLNEGHASFAILERCREYQEKTGASFDVALTMTRASNLFTTHTAVPAGFDLFDPMVLANYFQSYVEDRLKIPFDRFLGLGRKNPKNLSEPFNMAYLAIRGSNQVNGVSKIHEGVSKELFSPLFPKIPLKEVPVGHVTNGIHVRSWDNAISDALWTETCGKDRWSCDEEKISEKILGLSDEKIWNMRQASRKEMIEFGRIHMHQLLKARGAPLAEIEKAKHRFNPNVLTLGFARRFATYKRPNMLLQDPERLIRILNHPDRPVQLVIAGKAHPQDQAGIKLIQEWIQFIARPEVSESVAFISDYNVSITERLVGGVDLWINTPRHPWEACGTSGMKVLVNGGLNVSEIDGWWAEGYSSQVGWAITDSDPEPAEEKDEHEANQLYELLENEIIPEFYNRDGQGIPRAWVSKVRLSMATLTPRFSTNRSIQEYLDNYYLPAASDYKKRMENEGRLANEIVAWKERWDQELNNLKIESVSFSSNEVVAKVFTAGLEAADYKVEIYSESSAPIEMKEEEKSIYKGKLPNGANAADYTVRLVPTFKGASIPLENSHIVWQET